MPGLGSAGRSCNMLTYALFDSGRKMMVSVPEMLEQIKRGTDEILVETELVDKLKTGKPLRN